MNTNINTNETISESSQTDDLKPKTKKVKLWGVEYEIPSHMNLSSMIGIWKNNSDLFEALAKDLVENHRRFAWEVTSLWLEKHHKLVMDDLEFRKMLHEKG